MKTTKRILCTLLLCLGACSLSLARPAALQRAVSFAPKPLTEKQIKEIAEDPFSLHKAIPSSIPRDGKLRLGLFTTQNEKLIHLCSSLISRDTSDANMAECEWGRMVFISQARCAEQGKSINVDIAIFKDGKFKRISKTFLDLDFNSNFNDAIYNVYESKDEGIFVFAYKRK